ncbi:MAG TPA: hypothetical protein PKL97_09410 [Candidatus Omnitrophota bacterium]|nr:hypothetical protein [Candidatus Omnitrophota bacterium]
MSMQIKQKSRAKNFLLALVLVSFLSASIVPFTFADEMKTADETLPVKKTTFLTSEKSAEKPAPAPVAPKPIAPKPAPVVQKTTGSSESTWGKMKDVVSSFSNPFSEISARDAGTKPRIRPHFLADTSWNSNMTAQKKVTPGWQARISPGLTLEMPVSDKLYTQVDYTYSFATNQGHKFSNNNNSHNLDAIVRYDLSKDTTFGIRNNFQISEMPDKAGKMFLMETVNPEVKHRFGEKLRSSLGYTFQHFRDVTPPSTANIFQNDNVNGETTRDTFNDNGLNTSLTYDVSKKLSLTPNFAWNIRDYAKTPTKSYWQIKPDLSATYGLGSKTTLSGHFGWAYRDFDHGQYESEMVFGAGINHLFGKKLVWSVNYDKSLQDTFDTTFIFRDTGSGATNLDNYDRHYRALTVHRLGTSGTYNFNEKNSFNLFGDFEFIYTRTSDNIISNDKNNEKKMELGCMYMYRLTRYMDFRAGYTFGRDFSASGNPSRSQYTFHKVTAGVNVNF